VPPPAIRAQKIDTIFHHPLQWKQAVVQDVMKCTSFPVFEFFSRHVIASYP
jgi:hypothetical protein